MNTQKAQVEIKAWEAKGLLLERYSYGAGTTEPLPRHVHPEYQFALSPNSCGEYRYRGGKTKNPIGNVCVLHSGEPHAPSDRRSFERPVLYWMLYAEPEMLKTTAEESAEKTNSELPYFPEISLEDPRLKRVYRQLFSAYEHNAPQLEKDSLTHAFLARLIKGHAQNYVPRAAFKANPRAVKLALEFLHVNLSQNISLDEVAVAAEVGKSYLFRVFQQVLGMPPHVYQNQMRILSAKRLLLQAVPIAEVAMNLGFYDQSHFGKYFKRIVGTSPRAYVSRV